MKNIKLIKVRDNETYIDYKIYNGDTHIGIIQTIEDENRDYIFCRQIEIYEQYRGKGYATHIVNNFIRSYDKRFRFCIATNSIKAVEFWKYYLDKTKFNKRNICGEIWEIYK